MYFFKKITNPLTMKTSNFCRIHDTAVFKNMMERAFQVYLLKHKVSVYFSLSYQMNLERKGNWRELLKTLVRFQCLARLRHPKQRSRRGGGNVQKHGKKARIYGGAMWYGAPYLTRAAPTSAPPTSQGGSPAACPAHRWAFKTLWQLEETVGGGWASLQDSPSRGL